MGLFDKLAPNNTYGEYSKSIKLQLTASKYVKL